MAIKPYTDDHGLRDYRAAEDEPLNRGALLRALFYLLLGFILGLATAASLQAAEPCVRLQVRPRIMISEQSIDVQARVSRHEHHRWLKLEWDSDRDWAGAGSSLRELAGAEAPVIQQWWIRDQAPANYEFIATVTDGAGEVAGRARARILAPEEP